MKLTSLMGKCASITQISRWTAFSSPRQVKLVFVIDFEDAAFLPKSSMSFVLHGCTKPLNRKISDKVFLPKSADHGISKSSGIGFGHLFATRSRC